MKYAIGAGHTLYGAGTGAVFGKYKESEIARSIKDSVIKELRRNGHTVTDCTINSAGSQAKYLSDQVKVANASGADMFLCIHLNACESHQGNGSEIYTWNGQKHSQAVGILKELNGLGFKNRGVKTGNSFYIIKHTKMKAMLLEALFLDNKHDQQLLDKVGAAAIGKSIAKALK